MCTYPLSISIPIGRFIKAERERTCESSERPSERPKWIRTADCSSLARIANLTSVPTRSPHYHCDQLKRTHWIHPPIH